MVDDIKKYIYKAIDKKLSDAFQSILDEMNFVTISNVSEFPEDGKDNYYIIDKLDEDYIENNYKKIYIGTVEDPLIFASRGDICIFDEEMLKNEIGRNIIHRYLGGNSSLELEKTNVDTIENLGVVKITTFSSLGYYADVISNLAYRNNVNHVRIRSYLNELFNYMEMLSVKNVLSIPIDVDYGVIGGSFVIQLHTPITDLNLSHLDFSSKDKSEENYLKRAYENTDVLDIYTLESAERLAISSIWPVEEALVSKCLFVNNIPSFKFVDNTKDLGISISFESSRLQDRSEKNDFFDTLVHKVKCLSGNDVQNLLFGQDANDEEINIVSGSTDIEDDITLVKGKIDEDNSSVRVEGSKEDLAPESILIEGTREEVDDTKHVVKNVTDDLTEDVNIVSDSEELNIKEEWDNKIGEVLEEIQLMKETDFDVSDKNQVEKKVNEIIAQKMKLDDEKINKISKKIFNKPYLSEEKDIDGNENLSRLKVQKLENLLDKKNDHVKRMKRIMNEMQNKMVSMSNQIKEGYLDNKALRRENDVNNVETDFLDEQDNTHDDEVHNLKEQNKDLMGKMHDIIKEKSTLEKKLKLVNSQSRNMISQEEVTKIKDEGQEKINEIKRSMLIKEGEMRAIEASKKKLEANNHTANLKAKQLMSTLNSTRNQLDQLKRKSSGPSGGNGMDKGKSSQNDARVKQIQMKHDKLQTENKKHMSDLIAKKKDILDMKKQNTLMKNEVEKLKRKLMKYEKKAA